MLNKKLAYLQFIKGNCNSAIVYVVLQAVSYVGINHNFNVSLS